MSDYSYDALVTDVIDGDTIDADVDLGFDVHERMRFRLVGINAPEVHSKDAAEKEAGLKAKDYLTKLIGGKAVVIESIKDKTEKYGRFLGKITFKAAQGTVLNVNDHMIQVGLAKPYDGGKR